MTRINSAIPVNRLTDEHLLAEHREIKRLPYCLEKAIQSGSINHIPEKKELKKIEPKFKAGDYIERKDGLGCHAKIIFVGGNVYGCEKLIYQEDESPFFEFMFKNQDEFQISSDFKQNHIDKVEPKFHEGDWVMVSTTKGDRVVQIASVEYSNDGHPSYFTTEGRWFGNGTKARLLTDKDVGTITLPESKVIVNIINV